MVRWRASILSLGSGDMIPIPVGQNKVRQKWQNLDNTIQDQDQDSLLVKRRNDNHSPGPVIRELVPSSYQRSELSNTILCIFSG